MLVSFIDSDQALLKMIWRVSLIGFVISLGLLAALLIWKIHRNCQQHLIHIRIQQLKPLLNAVLYAPTALNQNSLPPLKRADRPLIVNLIIELLRNIRNDDMHRIMQIISLWKIDNYIYQQLKKNSRYHQIQALTMLGYFNDEKSLLTLKKYALKTKHYVQLAALRSLAQRHAVEYLPEILKILAPQSNQNTLMLADILERFGEPAVEFISQFILEQNSSESSKVAGLIALGHIASINALSTIIVFTDNLSDLVRTQAYISLSKMNHLTIYPVLKKGLNDSCEHVRAEAAKAIGYHRLADCIQPLTKLLNDPYWRVRYQAAFALYQLGTSGILILRNLILTKQSVNSFAATIAQQVLAEQGQS